MQEKAPQKNVQIVAGSYHLQNVEINFIILRQVSQTQVCSENCTHLCYYAAGSCNFLPTFRDNLSVPYSRFKTPKSLKSHKVCSTANICWLYRHSICYPGSTVLLKARLSFMLYIRRVIFWLFNWILWSKVNIINERVLINSFGGDHRGLSPRWIERFDRCGTAELPRDTLTTLLTFCRGTI
jgi:hypothetical protein